MKDLPTQLIVTQLIKEAVEKVYRDDQYLLDFRSTNTVPDSKDQKHAGERSIMFRFAYYLQRLIETENRFADLYEFNIDCEYNRDIYDIKKSSSTQAIVPDIIIHQRGVNSENILVIEIKTWWNREASNDISKIKELTDQKGKFKYQQGLWLVFEKEKPIFHWFENGEETKTLNSDL